MDSVVPGKIRLTTVMHRIGMQVTVRVFVDAQQAYLHTSELLRTLSDNDVASKDVDYDFFMFKKVVEKRALVTTEPVYTSYGVLTLFNRLHKEQHSE